ncbi:hypothetical protein O6H91_13G047300 [Diphasiastrum complanatum]|uniref:Uncharacterized protein n=1 Tax=Diphasiastrum complanatum TaxID=34168 RepID=A0ACC2BUH2_DIPCM|nr:hypothetical protein O6H91_13G047300 [Diphasiastrum complanatum]
MCPLRFILIFLSTTLAVYLAWKTVKRDINADADTNGNGNDTSMSQNKDSKIQANTETRSFCKKAIAKICAGFWILVDMASGRYLWHTLTTRYQAQEGKAK